MAPEILALLMLGAFVVLLLVGVPVAYAAAASGIVFGFIGFGDGLFNLLPARIYGVATDQSLLALPMFVFMGVMLEKSRLGHDMLEVMGHLAGRVPGGMAVGIILFGVIMGATTGIVGATIVLLGMIALPTLLKYKYDHALAAGTICASGTLGQIIPPSLVLLLLAEIMNESVGTLFAAALIPGVMLAGLYVGYILVYAWRHPDRAPPIPAAERAALSRGQLWVRLVKGVAPALLLVLAVLGSIMAGIAAPTEAAAIGALGGLVVVGASGKLSMKVLRATCLDTMTTSAMIFFVIMTAQAFSLAFRGLGGERLIQELFALVPGGTTTDILFFMGVLFLAGILLEWAEISYIVLPLFLPYFAAQSVDMVWLASLICINMQTSFLTPPVGWSLFFFRGVAPATVQSREIYRGVWPFIWIQLAAVLIVMAFPAIATWLPTSMGWMNNK
jgi:tripartite ATP-independent transporter DctM subunit